MTSSISCSGRRGFLALAVAAGALAACAHVSPRAPTGDIRRVALLPIEDVSEESARTEALSAALARAFVSVGLEVLPEGAVEPELARQRLRAHGVDHAVAELARQFGVEAVLVTDVERQVVTGEPRLSLTSRLVSVTGEPHVLWMDRYALAGAATRGILGLGGLHDIGKVERQAAARLAGSLRAYLEDGRQEGRCSARGAFSPHRSYRSERPLRGRRVVVLPFINRTPVANAGILIPLQLLQQFVASGRFDADDPGAVSEELRFQRIITIGGVSLFEAHRVAVALDADLIVSGEVQQYEDGDVPKVEFSTVVIDRDEKLIWQSSSRNTGSDAVTAFGLGFLATASEVACRMSAAVVAGIASGK